MSGNKKQAPSPPAWSHRLLQWWHPVETLEEVEGDLDELYFYWYTHHGKRKADIHYILAVFSVLPPFLYKRKPKHSYSQSSSLHPDMIHNYFIITLRTLTRNKLYTTLNVAGLAFGITCFLLIGLYLYDELTFDKQHTHASRIYRVVEHKNVKGEQTTIAAGSYKLAEEAKKMIPEVENTTRVSRIGRANLIDPENPIPFQETITVADENFLKIFDFPLILGDKNSALQAPNSIIINDDLAMRLFNKTQVLGKTLQFNFMDAPLKITGILKNHPHNSSFNFNSVLSEASFTHSVDYANNWSSNDFSVYFLVKPHSDPESVSTKITKLVHTHSKPEAGTELFYSLQALKDVHLKSENIVDGARNSNVEGMAQGSPVYIRIFSFIALFIVVIAGINYMNLATARASNRSKEIGVRKSVGAARTNLVYQFLFEALLVTGIAFVLAIVFVNLVLPSFNDFTNKQLSLGFETNYQIWLMAITVTLITGLLSGSYPAFLLSGFKPTLLLKGLKTNTSGSLSLRKGLVVFQFTIAIVLMIGTIVLYRQVQFMNTTNLGFNKDLLVVIDVNTGKARSGFEAIKEEMSKIPSVKNVSATSRVPGEWKTFRTVKINTQGNRNEPKDAYFFGIDKDFTKTFEIEVVKGRNFNSPTDSTAVLLNETAAKLLNISEPSDQLVEIPAMSRGDGFQALSTPFKARVTGIVKDFHFQSLRNKIEPLVLAYYNNPLHDIDYYTARIDASNIPATLEKLKAVMVQADKEDPFEYHFLDEQLALFYIEDYRRQTLLVWIALATIFIACLGLFGLATYSAEQRVKEIGIRKVLGATVFNLISLLSKDFLKLVLIANGIAFPIAWWAINQWLEDYAYHVELAWWIFALAGCLAIFIALVTVSWQAIRAALANPVKSLRNE